MNEQFRAAMTCARAYRNEANFMTMIYLICSPVSHLVDRANST
ncbi:hypothetical protein [Halomonas stenophila]|uniref:Uncharacterized protein n=1 Tax=Halomonas stenophila TaxID=795312 RepID=A0A7W5HIT3_9GAMM|nr:hypothetical protein [Halomonas stenophila]MBB3230185.1 hypothetical protein [Halomonas stenophila]